MSYLLTIKRNVNKLSGKLFLFTIFISIIFFIALVTNISPYLRGPSESDLDSHWPYYFVNTYSRIWIFFPLYGIFVALLIRIGRLKKMKLSTEILILLILVLTTFLFQIALVYFSSFGITVLFRRIALPGTNGYFTSALKITDIPTFLNNFPDLVNHRQLFQHALGHTPGSVLIIKAIISFFTAYPVITDRFTFLNHLQIGWAAYLWKNLSLPEKTASLFLPFFLYFLGSLTIIPFYFTAREFLNKNTRAAFYSTFLYAIMPGFSFFAIIFDPFYAIFPLIIILLLFIGAKKNQRIYFFLSGVVTGIGLFFTLTILTILAAFTLFSVLTYVSKRNIQVFRNGTFVLLGIAFVISILFLFHFNMIAAIPAVLNSQFPRPYLPWVFFNPYDFFVFMGVPSSILFIILSIFYFKDLDWKKSILGRAFLTFWLTFFALIISGASRGEVGRIWLPFMFLPVIIVSYFITGKKKFTAFQCILLFTLVFIQVILMEEYWVPIW